jgi:hypothetical protein
MYEEDQVKRLIQVLAKAIGRLLRLLNDKDYGTARTELHYVLNQLFGVSESMILGLSEEDVLDLIFKGAAADPERVAVLADVLRIAGETTAGEGHPDQAVQWYQASLRYLVTATDKMGFRLSSETLRSFESVVGALLPGGMSADLLASLYALYRGAGNHALASELIVAFTEMTHHEATGVEEARAYLTELLRREEGSLRQSGLSRERVAGMLAALSSNAA